MPEVEQGIRAAAKELNAGLAAFDRSAQAILTTDTRVKVQTRLVALAGDNVTVTGFAKGAAMIGPNLATMLAFVLTDAAIDPEDLARIARQAADRSFHCVSVEGHTSTNDTLLLLANGSKPRLRGDDLAAVADACFAVCSELAKEMAEDAEGATHLITITVEGLRTDSDARLIAKAVAESALVKTAIFGADPNWGRIVSAAGYAGVAFEEEQLSLWLGDMLLYHAGTPQPFDDTAASAYLKNNRDIDLRLRFTLGTSQCTFWTCDLGYEYIRLNAEYTT
jgi:glutamate N-acetyltransferase/amino-acid N-acetyltransferase